MREKTGFGVGISGCLGACVEQKHAPFFGIVFGVSEELAEKVQRATEAFAAASMRPLRQ
jgi:hypothetical protein